MNTPKGRARPKKQRAGMAAIRGVWTFLLPGLGFGVAFLVDNFTSLNIPLWVGLPIGALAYSAKRYWWPDSTF